MFFFNILEERDCDEAGIFLIHGQRKLHILDNIIAQNFLSATQIGTKWKFQHIWSGGGGGMSGTPPSRKESFISGLIQKSKLSLLWHQTNEQQITTY